MVRIVIQWSVCLFAATLAASAAAAQRTFVASNGADAAPCSLTQPCRSFTAALAKTNPNGEVIVLDSAGYGTATIAQSVSIVAPAGLYAGISVFTGNGITVDGTGVVVALRGLTINGQGSTGHGIHFAQGSALSVEDCEVAGMGGSGIVAVAANSTVLVKNTVLRDNAFDGFTATGSVRATLERVVSHRNSTSGALDTAGIVAGDAAQVSVSDSVLSSNRRGAYSFGFVNDSQLAITRSTVSANFDGLVVEAYPGRSASLVSDANVIMFGFSSFRFTVSGGTETIFSPGNNTTGYWIGGAEYQGTLTHFSTM